MKKKAQKRKTGREKQQIHANINSKKKKKEFGLKVLLRFTLGHLFHTALQQPNVDYD